MSHRIAILGSTGSIGCNALQVVEHLGPPYRVAALCAHRQVDKLLEQVRRFRPAAVGLTWEGTPAEAVEEVQRLGATACVGPDAMAQLAVREDVGTVLAAVVGAAGLPAVLAAARAGKRIALANKESLVVAGSLLTAEAERHGAMLIPVDSEHSAVFQACMAGRREEIERVVLTASGGPFRTASLEELEHATVEDALRHPTWSMGSKITIDSATMFNKGLELIEACWLFNLPPDRIDVVVHPESVVHSMVEFVDGSTLAQLSPPDMRTPIQYALTWPQRRAGIGRRLDFKSAFSLNFEPPDPRRFPALQIAYEVARLGGSAGAVMNAANEAAVAAFAAGKIGFTEIARLVERTISGHRLQHAPGLDDLLEADRWARRTVESLLAPQDARPARASARRGN